MTEEDYIATPEEDLKEGNPTTSDITQVPAEDPAADGSADGGMLLDDGAVDPGMEAVPEAGTEESAVSDEEEYVEDGAAELEGSPMEGLAR